MKHQFTFYYCFISLSLGIIISFSCLSFTFASVNDGTFYDSTAYTECKKHAEAPLYNGGILKKQSWDKGDTITNQAPTVPLHNLTQGTLYSFSAWVKITTLLPQIKESTLIKARLITDNATQDCIGSVLAKKGCWSFLKGGFVLNTSSISAVIEFQASQGKDIGISIASPSLQPFTLEQWRSYQENIINLERKRAVIIHVSDRDGVSLKDVNVTIQQQSRDFPFGSAISKNIIGNSPYQRWFIERFNAAVFENELKWYATEREPGKTNYTIADEMVEFVRANQIIARGHNIFWEDPKYTPRWVRNLTNSALHSAVASRIQSLLGRYKEQFIHWDVSNEMLHFDFYENRLGPNATLNFYETAHKSDPYATLFMNDYNVVETCNDGQSTVDTYIARLKELEKDGISVNGIGLEGHFTVPNLPLMRGILDKLSTLNLPIWLTEVDISKSVGQDMQAVYLEDVLREGFSHPAVSGIMLWTALNPNGCYQMCLTDNNMNNLPAGDTVDKLLKEWQTGTLKGITNEHGSFSFEGYLGEYIVTTIYNNSIINSTFSHTGGQDTRHFNIQI